MAKAINYATEYQKALEQAFPYSLYFGALYKTPNNGRYRWLNGKTIEIPSISVAGRVDSTRDTIATAARNYDNSWTPLTLENERKWSTLVHPRDVQQTNQVTTISNITRVFNEEQKFPEMDAYTVSKIYADWTASGEKANTEALTEENILAVYDKSLDEVQIEDVPSELMKTLYDFTQGWKVAASAKQINMMLINPLAVITPVSYEFSKLDEPSALSEGKYVYYEESHEDVFVLANKKKAIQMSVEA